MERKPKSDVMVAMEEALFRGKSDTFKQRTRKKKLTSVGGPSSHKKGRVFERKNRRERGELNDEAQFGGERAWKFYSWSGGGRCRGKLLGEKSRGVGPIAMEKKRGFQKGKASFREERETHMIDKKTS